MRKILMVLSIISISYPILSFLLFVWTMSFGYYSELHESVMDVIFYFIMFSFILGILSSIAGFICLFRYDKKILYCLLLIIGLLLNICWVKLLYFSVPGTI